MFESMPTYNCEHSVKAWTTRGLIPRLSGSIIDVFG